MVTFDDSYTASPEYTPESNYASIMPQTHSEESPKKSFSHSATSTDKRSLVTFAVLGGFLVLTIMATSVAHQIASSKNGIASNPKANEIEQGAEYQEASGGVMQNTQGDMNQEGQQEGSVTSENSCVGNGVPISGTLNGPLDRCMIYCNNDTQARAKEYKYSGWTPDTCSARAMQYCCSNSSPSSQEVPLPTAIPTVTPIIGIPTVVPTPQICGVGTLGPRDRLNGSSKCSITCSNGYTRDRYVPGGMDQNKCNSFTSAACCPPTPRP